MDTIVQRETPTNQPSDELYNTDDEDNNEPDS